MPRIRFAIALACWALFPIWAAAADDAGAAKIDAKAEKVLKSAAHYLQGLKSFSVDVKSTLHIEAPVAANDMASTFKITAEQPNRMAILLKDGDMGATIISDGKELTTYSPTTKKYFVEEAPTNLADVPGGPRAAIQQAHALSFMGLGALLKPEDEILSGVADLSYVGEEKLDKKSVHHVKLSLGPAELDLWIDAGDQPLVQKIAPDMAKALKNSGTELPAGMKLELAALFSDWQIDPKLSAEAFRFDPPKSAEKVDSLAALFGRPSSNQPHPLLGEVAPEFELPLLAGKPVKLSEHKDKDVVILDFWATWCGPCVQALPTISEVASSYKQKGVAFYAINLAEDADTVTEFLKQKKLDIPVLLDKEGKVGELYQAAAIPQTVLIGKDGTVEVVHVGLSADLRGRLTKELDALLAGKKLSEEGSKPEKKSDDEATPEKK